MCAAKVPFFNYPALYKNDEENLLAVMRDVCSRGAYILQKDLQQFENDVATYLKVKHAIGLADGTNALILGLQAMGIGAGDEVIAPSHTFIASVSSIKLAGAIPVLADCGEDSLIDPSSVEKLITPKTKAIMPVHLNGRTCAMDPLLNLARKHNLKIIEDAAQAFGSKFKGQSAGTFGACGTFSFYPAKALGCFGDGGALVTNDDAIAAKVKLLRDHGRNADGLVVCWGTNSRLDNLQAAILAHKLKNFDHDLIRRRELAGFYDRYLSEIKDLNLPPGPKSDDHFDSYQNYELQSGSRDKLRDFLAEKGIGSVIQWGGKAVHQFHDLGDFQAVKLPKTERFFERCFMLPMHSALTNDDVLHIINSVREFYSLKPVSALE